MAMFRYGHASIAQAAITQDDWANKVYKGASKNGQCNLKTAKSVIAKYSPDKFLLSHCFPAGHMVLMADGTEKPIELVEVGNLIVTHKGNIKPVTSLMNRDVNEDLVSIKSSALSEISCTAEHPFYTIKKENSWCKIFPCYAKSETKKCIYGTTKICKRFNCSTNGSVPQWVAASDLKVGDKTYTPTLHEISICDDLNPNRMRLLGYYVAEGRVDLQHGPGSRPYMIRFSIHDKEIPTIGAEISKLMEMEFGIKTHSILKCEASGLGVTLSFHCFKTALWFLKYAGIGSHTKKLSLEVMLAPPSWQKQFIGAWLNGDGSYDHYIYKSRDTGYSSKGIRLSTVSDNLKSQAVVILDRLEIHSNVQRVHSSERVLKNGHHIKPSDGWHISISKSYVEKLSNVVQWPVKGTGHKGISTKQRYRYAASTISSILSIDKKFYTGKVYNFSVQDDESYIINRQAVHNCTIIASVDTDLADPKDPKSDYLIKPELSGFVNNNGDAWTKGVIKNSFHTFIGGDNFLEHVQVDCLSKGKIIDAALREIVVGKDKEGKDLSTYYVDILVATDRKHEDLVRKIESKELTTMSMGTLIKYSICSKCGNKAVDETQACDHIKYQKNNTFFDKNGVQRKIAELCGHESEIDSNRFIEASWVAQPAFTGAVLRSFVAPTEEIMAKLEKAEKIPSYKKQNGDYLKAAGLLDIIAKDPEDAPAEAPTDEAPTDEAPPVDEAPTDEAPMDEESPVPEGVEEDEFKSWKKDLKKQVLRQISDEVMKGLSEDEGEAPRDTDTLDETLIRPASIVMHKIWGAQKTWDRFVKQTVGSSMNKKAYDKLRYGLHIAMTNTDLTALREYGYTKRDFLAVLSFIDGNMKKALPLQVKKTIAKLGGTNGKTAKDLLGTVVKDLGRKITENEARKILSWLRLMDYYN